MPAAPKQTNATPNIKPCKETSTENNILTFYVVAIKDRNMANGNHSNDNLDEIHETTDLDRCRINEYSETRCLPRCVLHKKGVVYGKESIMKKRVADVYGGARKAGDLNFKCAREWLGAFGRTMDVCARVALVGMLLTLVATSDAAPVRSRPTRTTQHHEGSVVSP
ncbi:uncharacterized protein LOC114357002 [Ostrinia furnacalis]|uniref:uncharacterized protein LOC114357002 n=1 Tax=Ostrinia furnacalis TaxID=93504 RepID=UPI00103C3078|nr:uncharacterized protein LOC114357002 [Ostrinia furnacalis]